MNGWKTLLFNGAVGSAGVVGVILDQLNVVNWDTALPPGWGQYAVIILGIANILLRHNTTGPAGWRS